ncbi:MAG TPA: prolyl oligopeptidase family serine peptidase, partial [Novosphingobium sp.]|nr:prolyl oligopeptidase family serine peptidase [Novosphingobium sp.]
MKMRSTCRAGLSGALFLLAPALAQAAAPPPPLDAYGEMPRVEDVAVSPDGQSVAYVMQAKEGRRVIVTKGDKVLMNGSSGENKVRGIEWADNDTVLLTTTSTVAMYGFAASKYELTGTTILPMVAGREAGLVFGKSKAIAHTTRGRYGIRTIGGRTVGYFGGIELEVNGMDTYFRHGRASLFAVDIATNRPREVASAPGEAHYRDWLVDAAGNVAVMLDISETNGVWKITLPRGGELARGVDPTGDVSLLAFGKDGSTVIYQIEDEGGNERWFEVPLAGGEPKPFLHDIGIERIFVDRNNGNMVGYRSSEGNRDTVMSDPVHQHALARIFRAFSGRETSLIDWTPDFSKVIVRTTGSNDSGTWFLVDVAQRRADPIADERPEIPAEQVGPISEVDYTAADGLEMSGVLTLPPGRDPKNLPVILLPHGGPASHDKPVFDWWAQAFASRGYAVFQPNFRGSTGGTDAFRHAGDGQWGRTMQSDISDGLAELAKRGVVDPRRACIVGASYGGYAALAGVTLQQGLYRCAVSVAGVADLRLMYATDMRESGDSKMLSKSLREQLGDPKGYAEVSPRRFAARADAPVLLIHGKDDTVVPYRQSQVMADALKDAGRPYELVT